MMQPMKHGMALLHEAFVNRVWQPLPAVLLDSSLPGSGTASGRCLHGHVTPWGQAPATADAVVFPTNTIVVIIITVIMLPRKP
jgi:hypothetical protein